MIESWLVGVGLELVGILELSQDPVELSRGNLFDMSR